MQPAIRATIAHISDLHINRSVDRGVVLDMLESLLAKVKPDVLIVSGDLANQPFPWQMKRAARRVQKIVKACGCKTHVVIPGNHDYKVGGNVGLGRLSRIPFELYFRQDGLTRGFWWRLGEGLRLAGCALWPWSDALREPPFTVNLEEEGISIFAVNSNTLAEMMAAGQVVARDLQALYRQIDRAQGSPDLAFAYRIALVHHHPAPLADTPEDLPAHVQDSFMMFYNAGLFVRELSRRDFNLVLHGHRHVAGFLRLGCEFPDKGRTVLPIASAGSASHPRPDDTRGHHFHVIEVLDDDTSRLKSWFFSATTEQLPGSCDYQVDTLDDVRRRRFRSFSVERKYSMREMRKKVQITPDGYSVVTLDCRGVRVTEPAVLESIPLSLVIGRPSYIRGVKPLYTSGGFEDVKVDVQDIHNFAARILLGRSYDAHSGTFDFGYACRVINAHVFTGEELIRHYGNTLDAEFSSITADEACESMSLTIEFPPNVDLQSLRFQAVAEYVPAPLKGFKDQRLDTGTGTRVHDEETERIRGYLRPGANSYSLNCPQPVPGMIYKIRWKFPEVRAAGGEELETAARIDTAQLQMLQFAGKVRDRDPEIQAEWNRQRSVLQSIGRDVNNFLDALSGKPRTSPAALEDFRLSMMVLDDQDQDQASALRFVCSYPEEAIKGEFYPGEGCAGFAFEKGRHILYHQKRDKIGMFIHRYEQRGDAQGEEPVMLASFPCLYPSGKGGRPIVIAVMNISSLVPATKLLRLFDADERQSAGVIRQIQAVVNYAAVKMLKLV